MQKAPVSVLIPTKNEARNLPSTLEALSWADQIIVFDSYSSDDTIEIAKKHGCEVHQRTFDNFADHKNWALQNLDFRNPWILILDADEKVPPALAEEIRAICLGDSSCDAYYVARQILVDGAWLKYAGKYPDYNIRLFRKRKARYERRIVHEHMVADGRIGTLKNHLVHIDAKGTYRYIERHNQYAEMEAVEAWITLHANPSGDGLAGVLWARRNERRRLLKNFAYQYLPFRPVLVFLYLYLFRLGFIMGKAGIKTCALRMFYEYMVDLYLEELKDPASPVAVKYKSYIEERGASSR
jgi:glycosyltransferase involved in cell wall biosynthesis